MPQLLSRTTPNIGRERTSWPFVPALGVISPRRSATGRNARPARRGVLAAAWCAGWWVGWLALSGCALPDPIPAPVRFQEPASGVATGDWDDLEAAVIVGASRCEMAIERITRPSPREAVFELRTITDEQGLLTARLAEPDVGSGRIELLARIGRFGSLEWEQRLIERVSSRLADLHGVDAAPVR